jgi:hypothetical protein
MSKTDPNTTKSEFEQVGDDQEMSLGREFFLFVVENKKWWMIPIFVVLALIGLLVALGSTGAAPFIYTVF